MTSFNVAAGSRIDDEQPVSFTHRADVVPGPSKEDTAR
jgi:hypothetical protein